MAETHLLVFLRAAGAVLAVVVGIGWIFSGARWWGVHHVAFLNPVLSVTILACACAMLSPLGPLVIRWIEKVFRGLAHRSAWVWMLVAAALFLGLRVREPLLGDGQMLLQTLVSVGLADARSLQTKSLGPSTRIEVLETAMHRAVFRAVTRLDGRNGPLKELGRDPEEEARLFEMGRWTYILLSVAAGVLLIGVMIRTARRILPPERRSVFLVTMLSASGTLLFFGYVENYSWLALAVCSCLLFMLEESASPGRYPVKTVLAFVLAVALHVMALFLLPAVLYVIFARRANRFRRALPWVVAGACAAVYAMLLLLLEKPHVLPLLSGAGPDGYGLLSVRHGWDLLNLVLLCAALPVGVLLWRTNSFAARKTSTACRAPTADAGVKRRNVGDTPPGSPVNGGEMGLQLAVVCGMAFVAVFNPELGAARDWDIFSVAFWPMVVLAAWKLAQAVHIPREKFTAVVVGFALLVPVPYFLVNVDRQSSASRLESLLLLDSGHSGYGWENLATYYQRQGEAEHVMAAWRHALDSEPNPRYMVALALELHRAGRLEEAEPLYIAAARLRKEHTKRLIPLCQTYTQEGNLDRALFIARTMTELDSGNAGYVKLVAQLDSLRSQESKMPRSQN